MISITRYKPLFSVSVSYDLAGIGVTAEGVAVNVAEESLHRMADFRLKPRFVKNTAVVFYEGIEQPPAAPVTSEPSVVIATDESFYFPVSFSDKQKIKGLKFHPTEAIAKEIGFPLLYNAVTKPDGTAEITLMEDVKVTAGIFTHRVNKADTGLAADYALLEVKDEKNNPVDLKILGSPEKDEGMEGTPQFSFSVDASGLKAGIYQLKVGSLTKKFFIANGMNLTTTVFIVCVLKNALLGYRKNLADAAYQQFNLVVPKA